jgi:tRNA(Ile)-lysidine synthetase-like protein
MATISGRRLRPLLEVRRADLHRASDLLLEQFRERRSARADSSSPTSSGELPGAAREDPMNLDLDIGRVRVRKEILPALAQVGPDPVGALVRLAGLARDESELLDGLVTELLASLPLVTFGSTVLVPSGPLRELPVALARRVVRVALRTAAVAEDAADAATVERLLAAPDGWRATLPGPLDASVERGWHVLAPVASAALDPDASAALDPGPPEPAQLGPAGDGVVVDALVHAASGMRIATTGTDPVVLTAQMAGGTPPGIDPARLTVRVRTDGPLTVRTRRDGDRIRTPGGTRSLGDVLGEVGVPRALRDLLPVVTTADGRPLWVPGVVVEATAHVPTAHVPTA